MAGQVPGLKGRGFCLGRGQVGADRFQSAGRGRSDQTVKWAGGQGGARGALGTVSLTVEGPLPKLRDGGSPD